MATVAAAVEDTRRLLYGTSRYELNRLSTDPGTGSTLTFDFDLQGIVRGNYISIEDEIMYVLGTTPANKTAMVIRGFLGTQTSPHPIGSTVEVNARFPRDMIKDALKQEINNLPPRLFRVTNHNLGFGVEDEAVNFPLHDNEFINVIDVRGTQRTGDARRPILLRWEVARGLDPAEFPNEAALYILQRTPAPGNLRVRISRPFNTSVFTDATDLVTDCGLAESMVDIPTYGAAWRLMSTKEIARTDMAAQPEPRRAEEVPPGHISSVVTQLKRLRDDRIAEEAFRLRERYPIRNV